MPRATTTLPAMPFDCPPASQLVKILPGQVIEFAMTSFDPSVRNFGIARLVVQWRSGAEGRPAAGRIVSARTGLLRTMPLPPKRRKAAGLSIYHDYHRRALMLSAALEQEKSRALLFAGEIPCGSQSHSDAICGGLVLGLLAAFGDRLVPVTPEDVKRVLPMVNVGTKRAELPGKPEIITWARNRFPDAGWADASAQDEHMADAIAAAEAALRQPGFERVLFQELAHWQMRTKQG